MGYIARKKKDHWQSTGAYYHTRLSHIYAHLVSPGQKVLELGCGTGELLASLKPSLGVGVDLSAEMVKRAATTFPDLRFIQADSHDLVLNETFDIIILSDILNELWDVQSVFERLQCVSDLRTRIIISSYSQRWQLPLAFGQFFGLSTPLLTQNWLTVDDIKNMLGLAGFEV